MKREKNNCCNANAKQTFILSYYISLYFHLYSHNPSTLIYFISHFKIWQDDTTRASNISSIQSMQRVLRRELKTDSYSKDLLFLTCVAFCVITFEPIMIQTCSAPQNDRLIFSFVKDIKVGVEKMTPSWSKNGLLSAASFVFRNQRSEFATLYLLLCGNIQCKRSSDSQPLFLENLAASSENIRYVLIYNLFLLKKQC